MEIEPTEPDVVLSNFSYIINIKNIINIIKINDSPNLSIDLQLECIL